MFDVLRGFESLTLDVLHLPCNLQRLGEALWSLEEIQINLNFVHYIREALNYVKLIFSFEKHIFKLREREQSH